jgi:superfamily II DNA or RNA helicase
MPDVAPVPNLPSGSPAALASCRSWTWTITGRVRHGAVTATDVVSRDGGAPDIETFLEPFDVVTPASRGMAWRAAGRGGLVELVSIWRSVAWPELPLIAPVDAPIEVLPHQMSPALAVTTGRATRLLLADPVGMGKTIEAGLVIRELRSRGAADRVLVLAPATLRDQWRDELRTRLGIHAAVIDRVAFEQRRRDVPPGIALFRPPGCHVMSIDLARQADVLAALTAVVWDVLVVDEAHLVAGDTARSAAIAEVSGRTRILLLLTATPHSGDARTFRRLCALGRLEGEPPIAIARALPPPSDRPPAIRREIGVRPSAEERAARRRLAAYLRLLEHEGTDAARLVGVVLRKRALSSAAALSASLRHRLDWLDRRPPAPDQPWLPFPDGEHDDDDAAQPEVLRDAPRFEGERAVLEGAVAAASGAVGSSSKLRVLARLLRRTSERVIVFTEYRDTLDAIVAGLAGRATSAFLHGGLDRRARADALRRFAAGEARVLVATDVAAEGLNLQDTCRLVIHFELPWTPSRLAQRDGRVDRFGQSRRVHVWRLVGDRRHEARVLAALADRVARIAAAGMDVAALAAAVPPGEPLNTDCAWLDVGQHESAAAAHAVTTVRRLLEPRGNRGQGSRKDGVLWLRLRHSPHLRRGVVLGLLFPRSGPGSRSAIRFVHVSLRQWPDGPPATWLPSIAALAASRVGGPDVALTTALKAREIRLAARAALDEQRARARWQASLFERRAASIVAARRDASATALAEHRRRLAELDLPPLPPVPIIALLVR